MKNRLQAFSLIEVLFYIAMLSVFIVVISTFWGSLIEVQEKGKAMNAVDSEALFILNKITETIRNAESITTPSLQTSSSTLSLSYLDPLRNPTIFTLNASSIELSQGASAYTDIDSGKVLINNIIFSNTTLPGSKGSIKIQLDLSYYNPDGNINSNYSQTYYAGASIR